MCERDDEKKKDGHKDFGRKQMTRKACEYTQTKRTLTLHNQSVCRGRNVRKRENVSIKHLLTKIKEEKNGLLIRSANVCFVSFARQSLHTAHPYIHSHGAKGETL